MAIVMQLRKMMTNTMWSNILWVMILLHRTRNLTENTEKGETSGKAEVDLADCIKEVFQQGCFCWIKEKSQITTR